VCVRVVGIGGSFGDPSPGYRSSEGQSLGMEETHPAESETGQRLPGALVRPDLPLSSMVSSRPRSPTTLQPPALLQMRRITAPAAGTTLTVCGRHSYTSLPAP
jgi:hypothetical protein